MDHQMASQSVQVHGLVSSFTPRKTWVRTCGITHPVAMEPDGYFSATVPQAKECDFQAIRKDGALTAKGPIVTVDSSVAEARWVELSLPSQRVGGIGVQVDKGEVGYIITGLVVDGAAATAGLGLGQQIVEIDGSATSELNHQESSEACAGPEGTPTNIVAVDEDGKEFALTLRRKFIPKAAEILAE